MDRRRLTRAAIIGAAAVSAAACAQQPKLATVSLSSGLAATPAERDCMARAMYFESNRTGRDGMLAVGTVVANRVASGRYGGSVCGVVGQKRQFAAGVMTRTMSGESAELARSTADAVLAGQRHTGVKSALHFHTAGLSYRYPNMHYVLVAGGNAFYEKRDSSGDGRMANARSRALALAYARIDQAGGGKEIQVAAATPLETPMPAAPSGVASYQVAALQPSANPAVVMTVVSAADAKPATPPIVAGAAPAVRRPATTSQPEAFQVASAQPVRARTVETRVAEQPVAYAQPAAPAVVLPKVAPAPKRAIRIEAAVPVLASAAPAPAKPAVAKPSAPTAAAPAEIATVASAPDPSYVASAFAAFD